MRSASEAQSVLLYSCEEHLHSSVFSDSSLLCSQQPTVCRPHTKIARLDRPYHVPHRPRALSLAEMEDLPEMESEEAMKPMKRTIGLGL